MCRFHRTLRHGVRHQEEVKLTVLDFRLLHEALVDVCALRRVLNKLVAPLRLPLLEESLSNALVNDD